MDVLDAYSHGETNEHVYSGDKPRITIKVNLRFEPMTNERNIRVKMKLRAWEWSWQTQES